MSIFIILLCILALVLLITWGKVNAFLAFLIISITAAFLLGIPVNNIPASIQKGIGDTLGSLVIILALGAMLGKLIAECGAAESISRVLMKVFGEKHIAWALMITGLIVGIPLFYNVGFVLFIPLIFSISYKFKLPAVYTGIPMLAALSVTHGFLPPHPSPAALVTQFKANMGLTLIYGLIIAIPTILAAGWLFGKTLKNIRSTPLETFKPRQLSDAELPGAANSFLSSLLPVLLLIFFTVLSFVVSQDSPLFPWIGFMNDPAIVMLLSVVVATFTLGIWRGKKMAEVMKIYTEAVMDVSMILFIIAGAGTLKQVFTDSGVDNEIAALLLNVDVNPLVLGWMMSALIRVCLGSATIAGLTTAGIIAPIMHQSSVDPNLMVLSIGAGSLMFSHVNDGGFWLFKQYFNLSIKDTLRSWSVMETIVAVMGLLGVLLLDTVIS